MEFLISANKGETPKPLAKIASGGELSRIMLALICVISNRDQIPTLIFDEIDTGVSGRAARKIGLKLKEIAKQQQVLCVTHLMQIAVEADHHLLMEKQVIQDRTATQITLLDFDARVHEIARIMGNSDVPSELTLQNARDALQKASQA
jgi:DNA repair protein RecN (Recombination protein N)